MTRLSRPTVAAIVFGASAAVLTLEILAVRLLAPYVGLTIETYTTIIGVVLAGIAAGAALGGRLADRSDPAALIARLLVLGGLLAMLTVLVVEVVGEAAGGASAADALVVAVLAFLPPAAVLSAVTPAAAKLEVTDLAQTGEEVGRISAWATAGALTGTFATGFVFVPLFAARASVLVVGGALVLAGIVVGLRLRAVPALTAAAIAVGAGVLASGVALAAGTPCERESSYYCAQVLTDPDRASGRVLVLDDLRHSYVDLADPTHLDFAYTRWIGDVIDVRRPSRTLFIGGGGFTLPRYVLATRPGARTTVLELDPELVDLARDRLGLRTSPALRVRAGDARLSLREEPTASADVVVGDAFGARSIPWHLSTRELFADVRRVLRPDGIYAGNLIDHGSLDLLRAEAATLLEGFRDVALIARPGPEGGNVIVLASERPLPLGAIRARIEAHDGERRATVYDRAFLERFSRDAEPLTDDHAPADQLLTPTG